VVGVSGKNWRTGLPGRIAIASLVWMLAVGACISFSGTVHAAQRNVFVAAAASLRFALDDLIRRYEEKTDTKIMVSYGSSGNLVRQILHGAPFEIFLSADDRYTARLVEQGYTRSASRTYAAGRIGFFVSETSPLSDVSDLDALLEALNRNGRLSLAIANPDHAPYGRAARECLQRLDLWTDLEPRLIIGENAAQAAQFAASGQIAGGVIPRSLVAATPLADQGRFYPLGKDCHSPLRQTMVLINKAGRGAAAFFDYLSSQTARDILKSYGFDSPEASM